MSQISSYIQSNQERFLDELFSLIRIPSISAKQEHKPDMERCARCWAELLVVSGADRAEVMPTDGNPVVYAEKHVSDAAQTVLVYGHYDVMPAEPLELWNSAPFEPEIRDGRIWARGADDDKGQSMMQVKGFETALRLGLLRCNVKFIFEILSDASGFVEGRCYIGLRYKYGECRCSFVDNGVARTGLLGNRGDRPEP